MKTALKTVVAAAALAVSMGASAFDYTTSFDAVSAGQQYGGVVPHAPGLFTDKISFYVTEALIAQGSVFAFNFAPTFNIDALTVTLYGFDQPINIGTGQQVFGGGPFIPGAYYFTIAGEATGTLGGQYAFSVQTAPVPEPETYAMLLAGLGVMGAIAARRKKAKQD